MLSSGTEAEHYPAIALRLFEEARDRPFCWMDWFGVSVVVSDFPLGGKPVLIGLPADASVSSPDFICSLANTVFQIVIHDGRP